MAKKTRTRSIAGLKRKVRSARDAARTAQRAARKVQQVVPVPPRRLRKSPLSKAQLSDFRRLLLEKRRSIIGDLNGIEATTLRTNRQDGTGDLSTMPTHPADIGSDTFEHEFTLGLLESERAMLSEIDEALERISKGTYGVCLGTGKSIGLARLRARPWAKYCIEYAQLVEKGLVRAGEESAQQAEEASDEESAAGEEGEEAESSETAREEEGLGEEEPEPEAERTEE